MSDGYQFKVRLGVVLIKDDRILLVRQNNRPFWVFPGGTLEMGEGLEECAIREIKEEVNLTIEIEKCLYLADFLRPVSSQEKGLRQTIDVFMLGRYVSGTPLMTVSENLNEMGFFTLEEFRAMPVEPLVVAEQVTEDWPGQFAGSSGLYLGKYGTITVR